MATLNATVLCIHCGETKAVYVGRNPTYGPPRFCSRECRSRAVYSGERRICEHCGEEYVAKTDQQRFCLNPCNSHGRLRANGTLQPESYPSSRVHVQECTKCGKAFTSRARGRRRCPGCRESAVAVGLTRASVAAAHRAAIQHACADCGIAVARAATRCKPCARERVRAYRRLNRSLVKGKHKKRALAHGGKVESVKPLVVYERDGWRCYLCGEAVRTDVHFNHALFPSLDHIVPLSRGGDHTYANTACAHRGCNTQKRDSMPVTLGGGVV